MYFEDKVTNIIREWKYEAKVFEPILFKYDWRTDNLNIYTSKAGTLIGFHGKTIYKYEPLLKEMFTSMKEIKFIETSGFVV